MTRIHKLDWSIITIWLILFGWVGIQNLVPTSFWFTVNSIYVEDTLIGNVPIMKVERTIHRPFSGEWIVEVEKEQNNGFHSFCISSNKNNYNPDNVLPKGNKLNLNWWTWPIKCILPLGRYRIDTVWIINTGTLGERQLNVRSNTFKVFNGN